MRKFVALILCLSAMLSLAGCSESQPATPTISETELSKDFDERFLDYLSEHTEGNFVVSPISLRYSLGMMLAGAEDNTKAELLHALGAESEEEWADDCTQFTAYVQAVNEPIEDPEEEAEYEDIRAILAWAESEYGDLSEIDDPQAREFYEELSSRLPENQPEPDQTLRIANSVWNNSKTKGNFTEAFRSYAQDRYAADIETLPAEDQVAAVNNWVSDRTNGKIPQLLPEDFDVSKEPVMLLNSLYFCSRWNSFDEDLTADGDFTTASGETVTKSFMEDETYMRYYEDETCQMVVRRFSLGENLRAVFVLGDDSDFNEKLAATEYQMVKLRLPKMDIDSSFSSEEFEQFLQASGVHDAFDRKKANFSGMYDEDVFIGSIIQKARIKTDEIGVEAAAVTYSGIAAPAAAGPAEPVEFNADRPFTFRICAECDDRLYTLFAGRVCE